jgi:hypothetical protein
MTLLPNEEKLITSDAGRLTLTNQRVFMHNTVWGEPITTSIFLEDVSAIEVKHKGIHALWIMAAVLFTIDFYLDQLHLQVPHLELYHSSSGSYGFGFGLFLLIIWWLTRRRIVTIASKGGPTLSFTTRGITTESIHSFIDRVSLAKQQRVEKLAGL